MKREYCLDIDGNVYTIGDLNMFLEMNWICKMESVGKAFVPSVYSAALSHFGCRHFPLSG